jgi:hypothetical protein
MSQNDANDLIDEQELRDSLRPLRPDRDAFESGVRRRLELATRSSPGIQDPLEASGRSPWLHVAASVIPFHLFGKAAVGTPIPLGKLSLGYKLIGYAALPATTLLLMVGATIFGLVRIKRAQHTSHTDGVSIQQQAVAITRWWTQFGVMIGCILVLSLVLIFSGYVLPVFLVFLASGIAMVSLVTRLGRDGMVDRRAVGGNLIVGLALLAQITQIYTSTNAGVHLLDQSLVQAVLLGAAVVLAIVMCSTIRNRWLAVLGAVHAIGFGILFVGFFARSLWAPVTTESLKNYVESFDEAPFHSSSWQHWEVPAAWLQKSGVALNLSKPRQLFESEIAGEQNSYILGVGFAANLMEPADLILLRDLEAKKARLVNERHRDRPIPSLQQQDYEIRALAALGQLTPFDRDILESRLLATLRDIDAEYYQPQVNALTSTKLLEVIDRPCDDQSVYNSIRKVMVDFQRTRFQSGVRSGGFASTRNLDFCDALTTTAVVELMEFYGVPDELDVAALRSYLRPSIGDQQQLLQSTVRVATKQRLESIPGVPPVTWWDYVRYEQTLWMSLMVAMLCFYATLGSPMREVDSGESSGAES